jgi:glycosyltransferase involved in cell wall biosynthesis
VIRLAQKLLGGGRSAGAEATPPIVLVLPRASASLAFRAFREAVGSPSQSFVGWWCERMRARMPGTRIVVMCQASRDAEEVGALLGGDGGGSAGVTIIQVQMASRLHAFGEVAAQVDTPVILFALEGLAFAPADLMMRVNAHHVEQGNRYTPVSGLPNGAAVEVFDASLLAELARAPLSAGEAGAEELLRGVRAAQPFDAAAAYGIRPGEMPEQMFFTSPREIAIAREVIATTSAASTAGPLDELRRWRNATINTRARARDTLRSLSASLFSSNRVPLRPRRVLFASNASAFSGGENSLCQLAAMLDRQRFKPFAILGGEGLFADRLRTLDVDVHTPGGGFGGEHGVEDLAYVAGVFASVRPDLVHVNSFPGWPLLHLAQLSRIPIVTHCRNVNVLPQREVLLASDRIITVSDFVKRELLRLELPDDHVRVIYNSVNTELFDPTLVDRDTARARLGVPRDARLILTIARYAPNKRHDLLLEAVALAKQQCPRLHLVLCGEILGGSPVIYDRVMTKLRASKLTSAVTFVPFTDDIRELHAAADALVLCSDREPLGRCVLEAMAMARPPIVTSSSGNHEVIEHGVTGFIVAPNDPAALARQIVQVVEDEAMAASVGAAARAYIQANLDGRESARQVMAIYDELITAADHWPAAATRDVVVRSS